MMMGKWIRYTAEELAWIESHKTLARIELHAEFCRRFDRTDVSKDTLNGLCKRRGWLTGRDGRIQAGAPSMHKGKKRPFHPNSARTQFKKGQRALNKHDVGYESIDKDGYVKLCVAEPNPWTGAATHMTFKHRWLWEKANGPVPKGMVLKCLDGNKVNCDPSNWEAIPMALQPRLNGRFGRGYDTADAELKPTIMAIAKLDHKARQLRKGGA